MSSNYYDENLRMNVVSRNFVRKLQSHPSGRHVNLFVSQSNSWWRVLLR